MSRHVATHFRDPKPEGWTLAQELLRYPDLLNVPSIVLLGDIRKKFHVGWRQARRGIGLARKLARPQP